MRARGPTNPGYDALFGTFASPGSPSKPGRLLPTRRSLAGAAAARPRAALAAALALCVLLLLFAARRRSVSGGSEAGALAASAAAARLAAGHAARAAELAAAPPIHAAVQLPGPRPLPFPPPAVNDALLRAVVGACAERQETYVYVHGSEAAVVASADFVSSVLSRPCPPVDIMLAAQHRSIGL
ncbi:hypothetical protein MNEG_15476 [Monoraphidium neglectum]|uniref:Uncharacterized protein n=1 Tax=Monoraphidium neglectum TaxID=145388 RepID=A0A0D2LRD8_9CHLO|nr:hypothetical protein MNEG_15476 [Monoraphidium neglectum]KIY92486.1 hypothetical protein MNEG_15476 [Monoraphidium neglectum]|eukprot:XP_013891506.1 hypothetical protein MNEG_15476 [Monoraphidium neglectum]